MGFFGFGETGNAGIATTVINIKNKGEVRGSKEKYILILRAFLYIVIFNFLTFSISIFYFIDFYSYHYYFFPPCLYWV